jgi:hypothetical protein
MLPTSMATPTRTTSGLRTQTYSDARPGVSTGVLVWLAVVLAALAVLAVLAMPDIGLV